MLNNAYFVYNISASPTLEPLQEQRHDELRVVNGYTPKQRFGDRDVRVALPNIPLAGRAVVLMDDVASTGRTLVEAAAAVLAAGAASVDVAVTHALFVGDALAQLRSTGVRHVWSSDAVPHATAVVPINALLAGAVRAF